MGDEGPSVLNRDPGIKIGTHYGLSVARVMPKFEFGAGLGRASVVNSYGTVLSTGKRRRLEKYKTSPIVHLGFRFTNGTHIIRVGVGYPELAYVGLGVSFGSNKKRAR